MPRESIIRALQIPNFIFYSKSFHNETLTGHSFSVTGIDFTTDFLINISGNKLEVPTNFINGKIVYTTKLTGEYILDSDINYNSPEVFTAIRELIRERYLIRWYLVGDFNDDFNDDFY
jgi:hypothetical protein